MSLIIRDFQNVVLNSAQDEKLNIQAGKLETTTGKLDNRSDVIDHLRTAAKASGWSEDQINSALTVLPKGQDVTVADLKKVLDKLESVDMKKGVLDLAMLLALINKICLETRGTAQEASKKASELQVHFTHEQADKIAAAAGWALAASVVSGTTQVISGATQIVGSISSGVAGVAGLAVGGKGAEVGKGVYEIGSASTKGGAEMISGGGKIVEAALSYMSQLERASEVRAQADATKAGAAREEQLKFADNMQEAIRATLQAMQQAMQSREQSVQKIFA